MDIFYFEDKIKKFYQLESIEKSSRKLLFNLTEFYKDLLNSNNSLIIDAYVSETSQILLEKLELYSVYGIEPHKSEEVIRILDLISDHIGNQEIKHKIRINLTRLKTELNQLNSILSGDLVQEGTHKISFVVLEKTGDKISTFGMIEQLEISINHNRKSSGVKFIIMPSPPKLEEKLNEQIYNSWNFAANYVKNIYKKFTPKLEVTIRFVNKLGIYEGNSLGVALTIVFIQELMRFYELRQTISFKHNIVTTGTLRNNGVVECVGKEVINSKIESMFYSLGEIFTIPQKDYFYAEKKLEELSKKYPERKILMIPINEISDVLNRRDVIIFKNQNFLGWYGKKVIKNKVALTLAILMIVFLFGFYYAYQDDNPDYISYNTNSYLIENKYGKALWSLETDKNLFDYGTLLLDMDHRIVDINNDGINEVLICDELTDCLRLYSNTKEAIWKFKFSYENLQTDRDTFENNFGTVRIIGINKRSDPETIIGFSQQMPYYPTAIIKIDLKTGKQVGENFWHSGGIIYGTINDFDNDGKDEVICSAINNGLKRAVLFSIEVDKLFGQSPKVKNYTFKNLKTADFDQYILLPTPDLFNYDFPDYFMPTNFLLDDRTNTLRISIVRHGVMKNDGMHVSIAFNRQFIPIDIYESDKYISLRDKLVKQGKLDYPLTGSEEYKKILFNQMKYWDGKEFVKYRKTAEKGK